LTTYCLYQRFPYSRHSSYDELCHLVDAFKPKDVYPCTTDVESWHEGISIQSLFGHLCSGSHFTHDREMRRLECERDALRNLKRKRDELSQQHCSQDSIPTTDGGDSGPDTGMAKEVSQSARPEKTPGRTKRHCPPETHVRTEEPNHAGPAMRLLKTPSTATQKASEHPSNQKEVTESRLQTTLKTVNSRVFRCAWLGCHEGFRTIGMLRRHVPSKHLVKVAVNKPVNYGCLWHSCAEPNISYFASEETWEAHMDEMHYHAEMQRVLEQGKDNEQQDPSAGSQRSLPSPPEDPDAHGTNLALEPADPIEDVQAIPIKPSNQPNEPPYQTDSGSSDDITLKDIHDPSLSKEISTTAQANTHWPPRRLSNPQVDAVTQVNRSNIRNNDYSYHPQYADKINRLRKVVPTASKQVCSELLWLHKGDFQRARELVAQYEEMRLASVRSSNDIRIQSHGGHQLSRHGSSDIDNDIALPNDDINHDPTDENTDASNETTSALSSTSAFHTPISTPTSRSSSPARSPQTSTRTPTSPSRLRHRKEAYEAARGIGGREWAVYSPVSAGNNHSVLEVEL